MPNRVPSELEMPALWHAADAASAANQTIFFRLKIVELAGLAVGAAAALVPGSWAGGAGPAISVLAFLAILLVQVSKVGAKAEARWYDARAAAEAIKSAAWHSGSGMQMSRSDSLLVSVAYLQTFLRSTSDPRRRSALA